MSLLFEKRRGFYGTPGTSSNPCCDEKKAQLRGVALNPPKEEGGGDNLLSAK
jgi:hypothetical protein